MPDIDVGQVRDSEATHRWLSSRLDLWGPGAANDDLIETLTTFCERTGMTPDEMIADCLRAGKAHEVFTLRTRARRQYIEQIERFETDSSSRDKANIVRSFFIHNGIAMNPSILA